MRGRARGECEVRRESQWKCVRTWRSEKGTESKRREWRSKERRENSMHLSEACMLLLRNSDYIYSHIYVLYIYLCVYIYILEKASYLKATTNNRKEKNQWLTLYTEVYTYKVWKKNKKKRVPMCARAYARVRADTRTAPNPSGSCRLLHHPPLSPGPLSFSTLTSNPSLF